MLKFNDLALTSLQAMAVFLDHSECSAARAHACDILTNLTSHPFVAVNDRNTDDEFVEVFQVSSSGGGGAVCQCATVRR